MAKKMDMLAAVAGLSQGVEKRKERAEELVDMLEDYRILANDYDGLTKIIHSGEMNMADIYFRMPISNQDLNIEIESELRHEIARIILEDMNKRLQVMLEEIETLKASV